MIWRPRLGHGRHIYEEQVHVPLILHASDGLLTPRRVPGVVELCDVLPTVVELVGATDALTAQAGPIQGRSLMPILRGEQAAVPRAALVQRRAYDPPPPGRLLADYELGEKFALVERDWKYIHRTIGADELYQLSADPHEERNLIHENPAQAARMKAALLERVRRLGETAGPEAASVGSATVEKLEALGYVQ
jgi:arylsulfatase A-like enzyme